jgi:hypothetical protein
MAPIAHRCWMTTGFPVRWTQRDEQPSALLLIARFVLFAIGGIATDRWLAKADHGRRRPG